MKLPDNWILERLRDVGEIVSGGTPLTNVPEYWGVDVNWITPSDLSGYTDKIIHKGGKSISSIGLLKSSARLMPPGSVLFSSRAPIGYVAIAGSELCTNQGFKSIIPYQHVDSEYLYYFLRSAKKIVEDLASGTTFKEISLTGISKLEIPIPPLSEQHRIVAKIEELFSSLDKGIESLKTAQQQLKVYRQAVLKWAFEGRLNNKNVKDGELPEGWVWRTIAEICEMKAGLFVKASDIVKDYENGLFPCYGGNGLRGYVKSSTHDGEFPLVGRQGALCGNVHLVKGRFHATEHAVVVTANKLMNIKWLYYKLISMKLNQYSSGVAQPGLSVNKILPLKITVPPKNEQQSIVSEIESRLSVCDKIEETITQSLQQAEALRQSILQKAFEGKLVPQDPNDPPARELLETIRGERGNLPSSSTKKKANGKHD